MRGRRRGELLTKGLPFYPPPLGGPWDVNKEQLITGVVKVSAAQLYIDKKNETVVDW